MGKDAIMSDFDMSISRILLVHQSNISTGEYFTNYCLGRKFDGLVFGISGSAAYDFGERKIIIRPGQMMFIPACSAYTLRTAGDEPFVHFTANFITDDATINERTAFADIYRLSAFHLTSPRNAELYASRFDKLLSSWQAKRNGYQMLSKSIIYEMLYMYFTDATVAYRKQDEYDKIRPAKHYIDKHFSENMPVPSLAQMCGISETHFRRLFVKILGVSPMEYRLTRQMMYAKDYLLTGEYTVGQVAELVGFDNANYFSRIFKQREGKTPTEFLQG